MKFDVIYADPPWLYDDTRTSKSMGMALSQYPCIPTSKICELPIKPLCNDDCLLFLWVTSPKIPDALKVIEAWGFKFITVPFVWIKLNPRTTEDKYLINIFEDVYSGMGHWTNTNVEYVYLGKRGHPKRNALDVKQVVFAPRGEHSAKPYKVRLRINRLCEPDTKKLELFGRSHFEGWHVIGNAISGNDITKDLQKLYDENI